MEAGPLGDNRADQEVAKATEELLDGEEQQSGELPASEVEGAADVQNAEVVDGVESVDESLEGIKDGFEDIEDDQGLGTPPQLEEAE